MTTDQEYQVQFLAELRENNEILKLGVRSAQIVADNEWLIAHMIKKSIELSIPDLEKDKSIEAVSFLNDIKAAKQSGAWDQLDAEYYRAEPPSRGPAVDRISFFGMSFFFFVPPVFKGVHLDETNPDWVALEDKIYWDQFKLDPEDRIDVADLDTLLALYNRLVNTEAIAIAYSQAHSNPWDERMTSLVFRIWKGDTKASFMKRGEKYREKSKKFTDYILKEAKQNWPDEITHRVISRMVRYFQNSIMYSLFKADPDAFCDQIRKFNSEFISKSKKLFLHFPKLKTVSFPNQSNQINGDIGASWFSGAAASISYKDFFKLKFNHKYVHGVAKYIQENPGLNDKSKNVTNIATAYLNICKEIACTAHDRAIHFKFNKIFKHRMVDEYKKSEIMNICYQSAMHSIISYDSRVGAKFSTVLLGNIENSIKSFFKLSKYDKNFDITDFFDTEDGSKSSEFFKLNNPSNLIAFRDPEFVYEDKFIYENNSKYEFLKILFENANLNDLSKYILEKKYPIGPGALDDDVSDKDIAEELSRDAEMLEQHGTKSKNSGELKISRQKVNRAIGDTLEQLKTTSEELGVKDYTSNK